MSVTLKDIAKLTGLGIGTISSYLNGNKVRVENKKAIDEAVISLGYVRNEFARGLKTKRSKTIGVIVPELDNIFSMTIISEIDRVLRDLGYGVIVCDSKSSVMEESKSINFMVSKMVDGLIVMPVSNCKTIFELPIARDIPVVIIDRVTDENRLPHIVINNKQISENATEMICDAGHKNIAIITGDDSIYTSLERKNGYIQALQKRGLFNPHYVFSTNLTTADGYVAMKKIVEEHPEVTAVFVTNYELTIGTLMAINECGKSVKSDYSVVGFDAYELSKIINPKLTIVNQPTHEIGKTAAEVLLLNINNQNTFQDDKVLNAEILVGDSIKKI